MYDATFRENGVSELLSPEGYDMAWTQYQGMVVDKLNLLTAGTPDESLPAGSLLLKYARDASMASLFNYASMAHNNHFFFNCISPEPVAIPQKLEEAIDESCSSLDSLKAEFLATANAMFGPGFVWLVKVKDTAELKILCTYIAGSPYPGAHFRRQSVDMATQTTGVAGGENPQVASKLATRTFGAMGPYSKSKVLAPGGADIHPILCVNTWEHVWLRDWGIGGKPGYLEKWWDRINWDEVFQNYNQVGPESVLSSKRSRSHAPYYS
ncbi:superoxide dismutase C-terminal domain containing protein [Coccidioides posadasii C735 delta SOWgp]|nr:superoxide dismutase C-terminal domain containing protein [Coccidioides posadasii C735 delta SOWgp]EER23002.1 superoxide dismutase C-terminal domain containing protein [Coccidioides posadasii C735 delta SOWgp]|eukprot:XP_003065147.1 superoxide dismutase C-terminal domain containing protein [Coccidioides posadasii C735 delta SOWgp]